MKVNSAVEIIDVTENPEYERFLYRCLFHSRKDTYENHFRSRRDAFYKQRHEYLQSAIPKGFHKKILIFKGDQVGTIEYAPAEGSGLPIIGDNVIVMNCIWVQRRGRGHSFGKQLLKDMIESEKGASGFATIALENYWGPYFRRSEMESLAKRSNELKECIKRYAAVIWPVIVRNEDYLLVDGYCRYTALRIMNIQKIYAYIGTLHTR